MDRVYVTKIEARPDSDAFFHDLDNDPAWQVSDPGEEREHEGIKYRFMVYERTETNRTAALEYLMKDPLKNCGMLHLLQKDGVRVLFAGENGALVYDPESRMHMLSAVFCEETASWLKGLENVEMFSVTDRRHLEVLASELGLTHTMEFRQFVYEKSAPPPYSGTLDICAPTDAEMDVIKANYGALSSDELDYVRSRGRVFAAHDGSGAMVGFIGIHLEGCMGMLEILPEYRRLGYATYLESALIARRLESGAVPFCQVACDNVNSLGLQKKLGLTQAPGSIFFAY